ncbi:MAG: hypothetical protein HN348_28385, partial [Proteobacteria bacterium]|nr:hypothetical protein [Pseudomonadota bacterium]
VLESRPTEPGGPGVDHEFRPLGLPGQKPPGLELLGAGSAASDLALRPFRREPITRVEQVGLLAASLAAAALTRDWPGTPQGRRCLAALHLCTDALGKGVQFGAGEPIADRRHWEQEMVELALQSMARADRHWALIILWLALDHLDRLRGACSDVVCRGVEATVRGLADVESDAGHRISSVSSLFHGLLGLAACHWLESRELMADWKTSIATLEAQLAEACDVLVVDENGDVLDSELRTLLPSEPLEGGALNRLPLLKAMCVPGVLERLPGSARRILDLARPE